MNMIANPKQADASGINQAATDMEDEKFDELLRTMRLMKSADPSGFSVERFVSQAELTAQQKTQIEKEFGNRKKVWIENSLFYNYFDNDSF